MMSVQRVPQVPFAQIANEALRDKRLSFKARGVLAMVLSHSGEWNATARWLEEQSDKDGRESIQSALNELNELGYREVLKERNEKGDIRTVVVWRQVPELQEIRPTGNPTVGKPDHRETRASKEHNPKEHNPKEHKQSNNENAGSLIDLFSFEDFWDAYPRKAAKAAARKAWTTAVKKVSADTLIEAAKRYNDDVNREDAFTAHAATWLNQERWLDGPLPRRSGKMSAGEAKQAAGEEMLRRLRGEG